MERSTALPTMVMKQWLTMGLAILWFIGSQVYFRWPFTGGIVLLVIVVATPLILRFVHRLWPVSWSTIGAVVLVMATSLAAASFTTSVIGRQLMAVASGGLILVLLQTPATMPITGLPGRLTLFAMTVAYWFGWLSLLSINIFLSWSIWLLAILAALLTTAVAAVVWIDGGVPSGKVWRSLWLPLWLGVELWLAIWALPTSILVGSVVATVTIMLWLQICRHVWLQTWRPDRGRRYIVVGTSVVAIVLLTARWI